MVGFVTFVILENQGLGEIGNNAVDPAYQGQGLGGALYQRVLDIFREHGLHCVKVVTRLDAPFASARAAYEGISFVPLVPCVEYYLTL